MACVILPNPTAGAPVNIDDYNYQNSIQQQLQQQGNDDDYILTEWYTNSEPEVARYAIIQHAGNLYQVQTANEAIGGAPDDGRVYIKASVAAGVMTFTFVSSVVGYSWNYSYNGYYHADGSQLLPFVLYKYDSTNWKKRAYNHTRWIENSTVLNTQMYPWINMDNIIQDDSKDSLVLPAALTYWSFSNPNFTNSAKTAPTVRHNIEWKDKDDAGAKHANRGITYFNGGYVLYNYTFGNEHTIMLRLLPKWEYDTADNIYILDNRQLGGSTERITLAYTQTNDKLNFTVTAAAGNSITIETDAYANNGELQIWHDIYIVISKSGNDADMYINNVRQGGGVEGTKAVVGSLAALNMTKTEFVIGANASSSSGYSGFSPSLFYIIDLAIANSSATTWLDNYDSGTVYPYYVQSWLSGYGHSHHIDNDGNAGFNQLSAESGVFGSIGFGAEQIKMKKIALGAWNMFITGGGTGSASLVLNHGLADFLKIVNVFVKIISDSGTFVYSLARFANAADPNLLSGGITSITTAVINLGIRTGGVFDAAGFSSTAVNRGYAYIWYEV